jgi:hypothetical protein
LPWQLAQEAAQVSATSPAAAVDRDGASVTRVTRPRRDRTTRLATSPFDVDSVCLTELLSTQYTEHQGVLAWTFDRQHHVEADAVTAPGHLRL